MIAPNAPRVGRRVPVETRRSEDVPTVREASSASDGALERTGRATAVHVRVVAVVALFELDLLEPVAAVGAEHATRRATPVRDRVRPVVALLVVGLNDAVAAERARLAIRAAADAVLAEVHAIVAD